MEIEKIDPNFRKEACERLDNKACYRIPNDQFDLYGVFYDGDLNQFVRINHKLYREIGM